MPRFFRLPKIQMAASLLVLFIAAIVGQPSLTNLYRLLFSVIVAVVVDLLFLKIRKIALFLPAAGLVTGLILGLLSSPNNGFLDLGLGIFIALFAKHFLRFDNRHVFNPAAFGLFWTSIIFGSIVSWWGISRLPFLIFLLPGYISVVRMKKTYLIISFLLIYSLFNFIFYQTLTVFDPTVLFFSLVMLPEPMTVPVKKYLQIGFGIFVAAVSILISYPFSLFNFPLSSFIPDPLITALLIGNLVFFKLR